MNLVGKPLLAAMFACLAGTAVAQSPGPQGGEVGPRREQEWRIPASGGSPLMVATVVRPPGEAKAPLVVINHGSPADRTLRPKMERPHFVTLSSFFVARGYVVAMPLRRGYGATGGRWAEDFGRCDNPDYYGSGLATAADIKATVDYMLTQPFVAPGRTIVVGHSAGGWGALALSSLNPPGIPAMIDFAGGLGGHAPGVGIARQALSSRQRAGMAPPRARRSCGSARRTIPSSTRSSCRAWSTPMTAQAAARRIGRSVRSARTATASPPQPPAARSGSRWSSSSCRDDNRAAG